MDEHELRRLMYTAQLPNKGPFVIRYPRGGGVLQDWRCPLEEVKVGTGRKLKDGDDVAVLSIGPIGNNVTEAINIVRGREGTEARGRENSLSAGSNLVPPPPRTSVPPSIAHYDMRFLKPLDEQILDEVGRKFKRIVTVENGVKLRCRAGMDERSRLSARGHPLRLA